MTPNLLLNFTNRAVMRVLLNTKFHYPDSQTTSHTGRAVLRHTRSLRATVLRVASMVKAVLPNAQNVNHLTDYVT
jgi:hypothetical protein